MQEFNQIPTAISHKKLNSFLSNAQKESSALAFQSKENQKKFEALMATWSELSKEILVKLNRNKEQLTEGKGPNSIMALGAMEVHLNMAIQAHKASEKKD